MAKKATGEISRALNFQTTEAYKKARTNIVYSIVKKGCKKIIFTSSFKSEGKTTTAINVALALSQQVDTKVLVIDCDLRRPTVHTVMGLNSKKGLVNYLNDECKLEEVITKSENENLDFITFGAIPPNPSELLASGNMADMIHELEKEYDYIIFDTPPVNMVVDIVPLIEFSDGVVFVVKNNDTTYPEFNRAVDLLKRNNGKILGIIINGIPTTETKKGGYYLSKTKKRKNTYYG
jgi:capsular exopolysaccharide synthesis family protein